MTANTLMLSRDERALLTNLLETALGETRVELHHTHFSPTYRDDVKKDEQMLRTLLEKLREGTAN